MEQIKAKEPWLGVFLNQLFPGLGQLYAQRYHRALAIIGFWIIYLFAKSTAEIHILINPDIIGTLMLLYVFLFSITDFILRIFVGIDGYLCVRKYNLSHNVKSTIKISSILYLTGSFILLFVCIYQFLMVIYMRTNFVQVFKIPTTNMSPVLKPGDKIVVDKKAYANTNPERGDIIIFIPPQDRKKFYIKRIVGLPGESLEIKDGGIYVNGKLLSNQKINANFYYNEGNYAKLNKVVKIPEENYYVLGDNSASSLDSRFFGFIPRRDIKGKAIKIFWPPERSGRIN